MEPASLPSSQLHTSLVKLHNLLTAPSYYILPVLVLIELCLYSQEMDKGLAAWCVFGWEWHFGGER